MRDSELYRQILGLEAPWSVTCVDLNVEKERVDVWVGHKRGKLWPCPKCQRRLPRRDHAAQEGMASSGHVSVSHVSVCTYSQGGMS